MKNKENLKQAIKKFKEKKAAKKRKRRQEELEEEKKYKDFWKREKELHEEKLKIAKEIMEWVKEFNEEFDFEETILFYSSWGHERMLYGEHGCWSRMYFKRPNKLEYTAGYKWMPSGPTIIFDNEKELAEKLTHKYLKDLLKHIQSGKVCETIKKDLEYSK